MRFLILLMLITGCAKPKVVKSVKMKVIVDTSYMVTSTDGEYCVTPSAAIVGDTVTCYWGPN